MVRISRGLLWCIAATLLSIAPAAFANSDDANRYEVRFSRTLPYRGGLVSIDHSFGGMLILAEDTRDVNVRATIRSSDAAFGQQIRILVEESGNGITVRTVYPQKTQRPGSSSFSVDYRITVPSRAMIDATNRFGSIDANHLAGPSKLTNSQGSITVRDAEAPVVATNAFGSIDVNDASAPLTLRNQNGSIAVRDAENAVDASNRFGSINVSSLSGVAILRNTNGSIDARDVARELTIENAFGTVVVNSAGGNVTIKNNNGQVEVRDAEHNVAVTNSYGNVAASSIGGMLAISGTHLNVDARDVTGNTAVSTAYGAVNLSSMSGPVAVKTSFSPVFLRDIGGAIDVANQNGSISVGGLSGTGCQPVTLRTSYSSLRIALPSNASYQLNARNTEGRIRMSAPIRAAQSTDETLIGTMGKGGCKLELINTHGTITIEED